MSLKTFHIIFVVCSCALCIGFGIWAVRDYQVSSASSSLIMAIGSFVAAAVLVVYGRWFLKKLQRAALS